MLLVSKIWNKALRCLLRPMLAKKQLHLDKTCGCTYEFTSSDSAFKDLESYSNFLNGCEKLSSVSPDDACKLQSAEKCRRTMNVSKHYIAENVFYPDLKTSMFYAVDVFIQPATRFHCTFSKLMKRFHKRAGFGWEKMFWSRFSFQNETSAHLNSEWTWSLLND